MITNDGWGLVHPPLSDKSQACLNFDEVLPMKKFCVKIVRLGGWSGLKYLTLGIFSKRNFDF
jgi:hypothetical protein